MLSGLYSERLNARGVNEPKRGKGRERDCLEDHQGRSSARGPGGRGRKGGQLSANRLDGIQRLALCRVRWKLWVRSLRGGE